MATGPSPRWGGPPKKRIRKFSKIEENIRNYKFLYIFRILVLYAFLFLFRYFSLYSIRSARGTSGCGYSALPAMVVHNVWDLWRRAFDFALMYFTHSWSSRCPLWLPQRFERFFQKWLRMMLLLHVPQVIPRRPEFMTQHVPNLNSKLFLGPSAV